MNFVILKESDRDQSSEQTEFSSHNVEALKKIIDKITKGNQSFD